MPRKSSFDTTDSQFLHCEDLGETREFTTAQAAKLLSYQEQNRLTGSGSWQPIPEAAPERTAEAPAEVAEVATAPFGLDTPTPAPAADETPAA